VATAPAINIIMRDGLFPESFKRGITSLLTTPVFSKAPPKIITAIIDITALLLKPLMASSGVIKLPPTKILRMGSATMTIIATTSTETHSTTNINTAKASTAKTVIISVVKGKGSTYALLKKFLILMLLKEH
jgi:hypothetical protein